MRGVIEHMADPKTMLNHMVPWLKPGRLLYITSTPNAESLYAELYREKWKLYRRPSNPLFEEDHRRTGQRAGACTARLAYFYLNPVRE